MEFNAWGQPQPSRPKYRLGRIPFAAVDSLFEVDRIRGARPPAFRPAPTPGDRASAMAWRHDEVRGVNPPTDHDLPEAEVLRLLGE